MRLSVGHRLALLIAAETATALFLLILGSIALGQVEAASTYMNRFIMVPIEAVAEASDTAVRLLGTIKQAGKTIDASEAATIADLTGRLDQFARRYRQEWQLAGNFSPDAVRMRSHIRRAGRLDLEDTEQRLVAGLEPALARLSSSAAGGQGLGPAAAGDVNQLQADLRGLLRVNTEYGSISEAAIQINSRRTRLTMLGAGLAGILVAALLSLQVQRAIAPRIRRLVGQVKRFQEFGMHQQIIETGHDEIAVLATALDRGLTAIAERAKERERFLAIAAHELKTPMTSIQGFAQAALAHPEQEELGHRALETIQRQAGRLTRLIEDLLLAARARSGDVPFHPEPLDLAELTRRVAVEVEATVPGHHLEVAAPKSAHLLADQELTAHALWSLFTYAGALSQAEEPIGVEVGCPDSRVVLSVHVHGPPIPSEEAVFSPFSSVQYEGERGSRTAVGLFLCRKIAQMHGGELRVGYQAKVGPVLTLELPA